MSMGEEYSPPLTSPLRERIVTIRIVKPLSEVEKAINIAWKVPGLYGKTEAKFLYKLARRKGKLVELGCWMGRTTAILLQAAAIWKAELTTVDAFTPMPNNNKASTPERWRANLKKAGLAPPKLLAMTTDEAAAVYSKEQKISLLFIDAAHGYDAVAHDLANWTPRNKTGGVVALHDMLYPSIPGVCQAVADWWSRERDDIRTPKWKLIGLREYTIAFARVT